MADAQRPEADHSRTDLRGSAASRGPAEEYLRRWGRPALLVGGVGAVLAILGAVLDQAAFFQAYLTAYFFWLGLALGCLAVLMIQNLTGGYWGAVIRRLLEAGARTLPLLAALFLPILVPVLLGLPVLYPWVVPGSLGQVASPGFKQLYLSVPFWVARAVIYFAVWLILARLLTAWSRERDRTGDPALTIRLRNLSGPGLVLFALAITFAAFDWLMTLEPYWFSSIFGAMVGMGAVLSGFAFIVALTALRLAEYDPFTGLVSPELFNRLGGLLLAFLMLWAYLAYSQFLLMYAGNLPEEISWYVERVQGGWLWVALAVVLLHFVVPFAFLIVRSAKRRRRTLGRVAAWIVVVHYLDLFWVIQPAFHKVTILVIALNVVLAAAIGGLWLSWFARQTSGAPVVAEHDPQMIQGLGEVAHEQA